MYTGGYLIPANSKKGGLIFNIFTVSDMIIFGVGLVISLFLMLIIPARDLLSIVIIIIPAATATLLIIPIPNYHNFRTLLKSILKFFFERQKYVWRGWCIYRDGE